LSATWTTPDARHAKAGTLLRKYKSGEYAVGLTYQEVTEILKVIDASGCDEVVLEIDGTRLVVRRSLAGAAAGQIAPAPATLPAASVSPAPALLSPPPSTPSAGVAPVAANGAAAQEPTSAGTLEIRAPMVGTFYRRPSPQEPVFVEAGQSVTKGQPLCLIEVMKLFTTIEAPTAGTVDTILPEDGALVEFDQLLFRMRPG
jgi:acetyl-CoA carboxylase biotin carboxyl carrier protein